jgi:transposase
MDRADLQQLLNEGRSLAEIGRAVGLHEATVGYWVKKHGLKPANQARHAAKGALTRAELVPLVETGMSTAQIAEELGRSKTTIRHWHCEFGLKTHWADRRVASSENIEQLMLRCAHHGVAPFSRRRAGGYRCNKCRAEAVSRRRRKVKRILVEEAGGACSLCGYDRCIAALEFHHLVPAEKRFALSRRGATRSLAAAKAEAARCALLCANCHAEVEAGVTTISGPKAARVQCDVLPRENNPG